MSRSLIARLRAPHVPAMAGTSAERALRDSVLEHLRAMVRTRLGTVAMRLDYGLPDVTELVHELPEAAETLVAALRNSIAKYEPRLTDVRVRHVPSEPHQLVVRLEVSARLADVERGGAVRFETCIEASRAVRVT